MNIVVLAVTDVAFKRGGGGENQFAILFVVVCIDFNTSTRAWIYLIAYQ